MHHSPLGEQDGIILGASSTAQIEASLKATELGPLAPSLVKSWDELHMDIADSLPNYHA